MLEKTTAISDQTLLPSQRQDTDDLDYYTDRLRSYGARPIVYSGDCLNGGPTAGGVPLRISVASLVQSELPKDSLVRRLAMLLEEGVPVTLALCDLGPGDEALSNFERFCEGLSSRLPKLGPHSAEIGLCIQSHQVPLQNYLLIANSLLCDGPRYVSLDSLQMQDHCNRQVQEETDRNWSFLWRQCQTNLPLWPAYGCSVRAPCPLLVDEIAGSMLPVFGVRVPADSAWLPIELCLTSFSDGCGNVRREDLREAAKACVDVGERILDCLSWSLPRHGWDAAHNRRLAVQLSGLGDLVLERDGNPSDWRCLQWLDRIVADVHTVMWERSRALAQLSGVLPAIKQMDPSTGWDCDKHRDAWQFHWQHALEEHAVRHRNILVISPYSVLPHGADRAATFTDLLPVLSHADACAFATPPDFSNWNVNEFSTFHRRAWVVMQRRIS